MKLYCFLPVLLMVCHAVAEVREITDPASYSAGQQSREAIDRWFQTNIPEENFNLWHGKTERIYLHGAWKFRLLENSRRNPQGIDRNNRGKSADGVESDYGEQAGFQREDFDDSAWFYQPVPCPWRDRFLQKGNVKGGDPYSDQFKIHEGWYRRSFRLPESWKQGRVLLHFRGIAARADVYLNGQKIGSHENSRPNHLWIGSGRTEDRFALDLSEHLKPGSNLLAVKVFSPFRNGGIWQAVYLERKPEIFTEKILVAPDTGTGRLTLRLFFVNTTGRRAEFPPEVELKGWCSFRYRREWPPEKFPLARLTIPAGRSEQTVSLQIKKPHLWSPAAPNLYHLILRDRSTNTILGQERFGFRTFSAGKNSFLLNGKKIYLRGENYDCFGWSFCGYDPMHRQFGVLNRERKLEEMLKNYLRAGYNIFRANGNLPLELCFDIADEIGLLFTTDDNPDITRISLENGRAVLSEGQKESIRQRCFTTFNHPAVVTGTSRNEAFEKQLIGTKFETCGWAPILNAYYNEYRKWDTSRPRGSSSGRGWKGGDRIYMPAIETAKADYDICHPYVTNRKLKSAETDSYAFSYRRFKDNYAREHGGAERVMLVGESSEFYTFSPTAGGGPRIFRNRVRDFSPHIRNGEFDRNWLAKHLQIIQPDYLSEACEYSLIPLVESADVPESLRIQAWHNRQIMEQFRRRRDVVAGYIMHMSGTFKDFTFGEYWPQTFAAAQMAQQPVLACFSGFAPRNLLIGRTFSSELYLMNDSEQALEHPSVHITRSGDPHWRKRLSFPTLAPGEMKKVPVAFPIAGRSGDDKLFLTVFTRQKQVSRNEFEIFVQNPAQWRIPEKSRTPLALWGSHPGLTAFLDRLNLPYRIVDQVPDTPEPVLILLPGRSREQWENAVRWVNEGGKAVALEQDSLCDAMRLRTSSSGFRDRTELVVKSHPLFRGLRQDHFRYWNGVEGNPESMNLFHKAVLPLHAGVLAMNLTHNYRLGMTVAEFRSGRGRWLLSQLRVLERLEHDAAAARYLFNLLEYVSGGFDDARAPQYSGTSRKTSYQVDPARIITIDLAPYVNMGFRDEKAHDKRGGWSDHGPDHDARMFPTGKRQFAGVPFKVIDPAANGGRSCLVLRGGRGTESEFLPDRVEQIKIGIPVKKLYFLMTSKYTPKAPFGEIKIHMNIGSGGGTVAEHSLQLTGFRNLGDWWNVKDVPEALIGWREMLPDSGTEVGVYVLEWTNPERAVKVESIDLISYCSGMPILIGISALQ